MFSSVVAGETYKVILHNLQAKITFDRSHNTHYPSLNPDQNDLNGHRASETKHAVFKCFRLRLIWPIENQLRRDRPDSFHVIKRNN